MAKISARIFAKISTGIFAKKIKFQKFGSNLNNIFYKILVNLNILPIIFAVVLLSLLQYYNKNPVRNLVSISAILLLKYCYTFSYRKSQKPNTQFLWEYKKIIQVEAAVCRIF